MTSFFEFREFGKPETTRIVNTSHIAEFDITARSMLKIRLVDSQLWYKVGRIVHLPQCLRSPKFKELKEHLDQVPEINAQEWEEMKK